MHAIIQQPTITLCCHGNQV